MSGGGGGEPGPDGADVPIRTSVPGEVGRFAAEAHRIADLAAAFGLAPDRVPGVALAVHECLVNAWEHGHGRDATAPVAVEITRLADGTVSARIDDQARAGPWRPEPVGAAATEPGMRGHGRRLVAAGADEVVVRPEGAGTSVELRFRPRAG